MKAAWIALSLLTAATCSAALNTSLRVGGSGQLRTDNALPLTPNAGAGVWGSYDFNLSPHFGMGIVLAYRYYWGQSGLGQVGYGLMLRHPLGPDDWRLKPFVQYGLLFQLSTLTPHSGVAASDDTLLGGGLDWTSASGGWGAFLQLNFHISYLGGWDVAVVPLNYLEAVIGVRWDWVPGNPATPDSKNETK